jgi:bifunctional non-homologous end joining protein LigD
MNRNRIPTERIALSYRQGASDKIYQAAIEPRHDLYVVNVAFGRRGAALQTATKTSEPVDLATAQKVFRKVVAEKKAKGYTEADHGTPYTHAEATPSGLRPQLLNAVDESEAARLLSDPDWCAQEKHDGQRRLVKQDGAELCGINKKGLTVGLPSVLIPQLRALGCDFILDAELVGEHLHVFDLLLQDETTWMLRPYGERLDALRELLRGKILSHVHLVETAWDGTAKFQLLQRLKARNAEGLVLKRLTSTYEPGKPNSGGPALKLKFTATASVIVAQVNAQRSVAVKLFGQNQPSGSVTIPPNYDLPPAGAVVEVRYLYAFRESGALYQPVYLGQRDDVDPEECTADQLKWKATDADVLE